MSNLKKLYKVYIGLVKEAYQGLGWEEQEEERQLLKEVICAESGCSEEKFDDLIKRYIEEPCMSHFHNIKDCCHCFKAQMETIRINTPIIYSLLEEEE